MKTAEIIMIWSVRYAVMHEKDILEKSVWCFNCRYFSLNLGLGLKKWKNKAFQPNYDVVYELL
jgi:hypothetical protein